MKTLRTPGRPAPILLALSRLPSAAAAPWRGALAGIAAAVLSACASTPTPEAAVSPDVIAPAAVVPAVAAPVAAAAVAPAVAATPADENESGAAVAGAPTDPLDDGKAVPLDDPAARQDLWGRVRAGFQMPVLDSDLVRVHETWYASRPDYVQRMTDRGSRYLYHVVEEVQSRGMPTELALLPFIESAFNPQAMSVAAASGMWQFVPATGRDYDLKQNIFRDDRRNVLASTRAALDYLERLHRMFGDWRLALAAYNWGEGNVQKAIARNLRAGLPTDYESLRMPQETQNYVPKLQAVKNIIADPQAFGLTLPQLDNHPYFLSVPIQRDIDVALTAQLAGLTAEEFRTLNPQMNKPVILAAGTEQILLPYDNVDRFVRNLAAYRGRLASWTAWVVPRTMKPADAAKDAGMSEAALREVNKIPPRMLVKAGSTLLVPRGELRDADVSSHLADNAQIALAPDVPPLRRLSVKARKGDTLARVAGRYNVTTAQLVEWNKLSANAKLTSGAALVVYVPRGKAVAVAKAEPKVESQAVKAPSAKAAAPKTAAKAAPTRVASKAAGKPVRKVAEQRHGTRVARQ